MSEIVVKEIIRPIMGAVLPGIKKDVDKNAGVYIAGGLGIAGTIGVVYLMLSKLSHSTGDLIEENDDNDEFEILEDE